MDTIDLAGHSIYKISHGIFVKQKSFRDRHSAEHFQKKNWIVIHSNTGKGQGARFADKLKIGDYVYICHASHSLSYLAKVTSTCSELPEEDREYVKGEEEWIYRQVEPLHLPINKNVQELVEDQRFWLPSGYSTIHKVPLKNLEEFNAKIAIPKYNVRMVNSNKEDKQEKNQAATQTFPTYPKNIILYGPPGTGKTYNSIDKAVEIVTGNNKDTHEDNKEVFDDLKKEGQIEFVTFHQNYSYEDFIGGLSPDLTATGSLRFERRDGIFKQLADRAKKNWLAANEKDEYMPDFEHVFNSFFNKLIEEEVQEVEIPMRLKGYTFKITSIEVNEGRIKFTKKSGGKGHDLLVGNVKGIYEGSLDYSPEGLGVYYYPLVEQLKEHASSLKPAELDKEELKNYVLIIDEINRANISRVFGELITLLEDDKRLGAINELRVRLPNGEKDFGIPPNLYLIGTMNTADKSIALVDIALRRRFEFIGKYPIYEGYDEEAAALLKRINDSVFTKKNSADFLIGHAYFMKNQPIKEVLRTKIVPLLMEYFSGKTEIVSSIFEQTEWNVQYNTSSYSWDINKK